MAYTRRVLLPFLSQAQAFLRPRALAHHVAEKTSQPLRQRLLLASDRSQAPGVPLPGGRGVLSGLTSAGPAGRPTHLPPLMNDRGF